MDSTLRVSGTDVPADVGARIRAMRLALGRTLADAAGDDINIGFVSKIEHGGANPTLSTLLTIARNLGVPVHAFFPSEEGEGAAAEAELLMNEAAAAYHRGDPLESLRVLQLLEGDDASGERAAVLSLRGRVLLDLSRPVDAIPVLHEALPLAEAGNDQRLIVETRGGLAVAHYILQNYEEARRILEPALGPAEELGDPLLTGKVLTLLGDLHFVQHDADTAIAHYELARRQYDAIHDLGGLAGIYSGLSHAHHERGDLAAALRYSRLATGIYEAQSWQRAAANERNTLAQRYIDVGQLERAVDAAELAIGRAAVAHAPDLEALARATRAQALLRMGKGPEAKREAEEILRIAGIEGSRAEIDAWLILAELAEEDGETEEADELYTRAIEAFRRLGHTARYAEAARAFSRVLKARGDLAGAWRWLEEVADSRGVPSRPRSN